MINSQLINIMLVDDHDMILKGVRGLLETQTAFRVVAEATGEEDALLKANEFHKANKLHEANGPEALHLVVTDLEMPHVKMPRGTINGIQLTKKLLFRFPALRVLVYTYHDEEKYIFQAIEAGAWGFVTKGAESAGLLIEATRRIVNGHKVFPPVLKPEEHLTPTERQVLWLLGDGKSNAYIAAKLRETSITKRTVEKHRSNIWDKLKEYLSEEDSENPTVLINIATRYRDRCPFPIIIDTKMKDGSSH
ncbi:response regulator transcription factor [Nitrosospira sp. NRS527]|uniref:response regulator n=1 Tax=Nitrosospira sp. NRS527 TaxID=155925 RepID=UPI001AFB128C|nr:response regulator transcription factor [Nitrosospira sp. NRS527]BCT67770.1 Transcriptional regulatory protein DegU [Nitrosospira sp. NRS527]